jgi:hypothetical protein
VIVDQQSHCLQQVQSNLFVSFQAPTQKKNIWQDKSINEVIDDYILSPTNMKQNKTKPYQACFLSAYDIVLEMIYMYIHKLSYTIRRV